MSSLELKAGKYKITFGVTHFPNRKQKCLYKMRGAMIEPLAYFRNDIDADQFERIMDLILQIFNGERKGKK